MARKGGNLAGRLALGAGALMLAAAAPGAVLATGLAGDSAGFSFFTSFTPASADPRMAELVAKSSKGETQMMRFTPAGASATRTDRSVTVAVRVDQEVAQAISSGVKRSAAADSDAPVRGLRIAATRFNLGIARGYSSFAQPPAGRPAISDILSSADIPDLSEFEPSEGARRDPSRFAARIEFDENLPTTRSGEAVDRAGDQMLDVGGSYRLSRNLNVTAGVRYQHERDLAPLPNLEQQDSQAVYVGTQFRF